MTEVFPLGVKILVKDPDIDIATFKEIARIRARPGFDEFVARGGLETVVRDAREKLCRWELERSISPFSS